MLICLCVNMVTQVLICLCVLTGLHRCLPVIVCWQGYIGVDLSVCVDGVTSVLICLCVLTGLN